MEPDINTQKELHVMIFAGNTFFSQWLSTFVGQCRLLFPNLRCTLIEQQHGGLMYPEGKNDLVFIDDHFLLDRSHINYVYKTEKKAEFVLILNRFFEGTEAARIRSCIAKNSLHLKRHISVPRNSPDTIRREVIAMIKEKLR